MKHQKSKAKHIKYKATPVKNKITTYKTSKNIKTSRHIDNLQNILKHMYGTSQNICKHRKHKKSYKIHTETKQHVNNKTKNDLETKTH